MWNRSLHMKRNYPSLWNIFRAEDFTLPPFVEFHSEKKIFRIVLDHSLASIGDSTESKRKEVFTSVTNRFHWSLRSLIQMEEVRRSRPLIAVQVESSDRFHLVHGNSSENNEATLD